MNAIKIGKGLGTTLLLLAVSGGARWVSGVNTELADAAQFKAETQKILPLILDQTQQTNAKMDDVRSRLANIEGRLGMAER